MAEEEVRHALEMRLEEEIWLAAARETLEARFKVEEEARIAEEKRLAKARAEVEERIEKEKVETSQTREETMAPPMVGRKDPRRALQRVPRGDLTTASRMVPSAACLKAP
jgi:hypothetical protein